MLSFEATVEPTIVRRVFPAWSIEIPAGFEETFVADDSYWHAWDEARSVSATSLVITEAGRPVSAPALLRQFPPVAGRPVAALPNGLVAWAVTAAATRPARASRLLSGLLATDGRLLIATVTSDDLAWAERTWLSIRHHVVPLAARD
ncbi:MAG: hypothetical protein A2V84_09970 [Chloroflexi bacterium RBG_16_70_13]|nr:MAG: hypothetical protein A2V84_09970 [Chloroflexi bacterium RBG_16_70_13]